MHLLHRLNFLKQFIMQKSLIISTIIIFLAACGFKGPLYLPSKQAEPAVESTTVKPINKNIEESTIREN